MKRIGIDVGGTNTDAVLLDGNDVVATIKTSTTTDVTTGVATALNQIVEAAGAAAQDIAAVMVGTTHYTNAVIERRNLDRVAAVRISLPASATLTPFCDWPADLAAVVDGGVHMIHGGHEYDGRPIVPLDELAVADAARAMRSSGVTAVAISAAFSPLTSACEDRAAEIVQNEHPDALITKSSALGRIGLLERENVALMNASLVRLAGSITDAFVAAVHASGLQAELFITQNDGTIVRADAAKEFPVFSFASGPTNSMRGAALLAGRTDAMVCDVGGTTADIGCLINGFPRQANNVVSIGGVRTLFRMPDVASIAIGGGTIIANSNDLGPQSVGYRLASESLVFGGDTLTLTDIAVAAELIELGDPALVRHLDPARVRSLLAEAHAAIAEAVDRSKTDAAELPLLAVGGGAMLVPDSIEGIDDVLHVEHQGVANAVGAAIAQVSGECDQIYRDIPRDQALRAATEAATTRAAQSGAEPSSIEVVETEDLPISYLPGNSLRVRVRVVGDLPIS
ncbi:UNVERIFIED_CONTAM: hypothetical protein GTU68_007093 [Idotea baltica]|nr:hypothetical protein [Idotea baltica]